MINTFELFLHDLQFEPHLFFLYICLSNRYLFLHHCKVLGGSGCNGNPISSYQTLVVRVDEASDLIGGERKKKKGGKVHE